MNATMIATIQDEDLRTVVGGGARGLQNLASVASILAVPVGAAIGWKLRPAASAMTAP